MEFIPEKACFLIYLFFPVFIINSNPKGLRVVYNEKETRKQKETKGGKNMGIKSKLLWCQEK